VIATIVTSAWVFCLEPNLKQREMLEEQRRDLLQKIGEKKKATDTLRTNQFRFENEPAFVEYIARLNFRIKKDEFIFISVND